ncbi:MAG TPA: hypothetical protein IGS53_02085 [Leptolyngbyaceae cyanobacterium M33_DOE_097]|uniref:Uncharacterized protein n=1 Tax=Oscillatoriales cyanobacterium SpSt-418 TaxID=2282169 RepID=A0A7C3PT85_9CYAN|nr:hypothetical protein [Leptolyngbyaceae cyanobacterium M33_DOE_097]
MSRFRVHNLPKLGEPINYDDVSPYLWNLHARLHNAIHAETRVYTCRSWRLAEQVTASYELHWNDLVVPGETLLGSFGWAVSSDLIARIEAEFAKGEAVRLFVFNSDADLCFEEVLEPID